MNERIRQLAKEAGAGEWGDSLVPAMMDIEKFAELIVRKCMNQVRDELQYITDYETADQVVNAVKQHFGGE